MRELWEFAKDYACRIMCMITGHHWLNVDDEYSEDDMVIATNERVCMRCLLWERHATGESTSGSDG